MSTTFDILQDIGRAVVPEPVPVTKTGTVTVASPLQVAWVGEDDSGAVWPKLDLYNPTVGDTVIALQHGNTWLVTGSTGSSTEGFWNFIGAVGQPGFQNSWVNTVTATDPKAAFYKEASGWVTVHGIVTGGVKTGNTVIFSLPAGCRPASTELFTAPSTGTEYYKLAVLSNGNLVVQANTTNATYAAINVRFLAEN